MSFMAGVEFLFTLTLLAIIAIIVYYIPEEIFNLIVSIMLLPVILTILGLLIIFWVVVTFFRVIHSLFQK